MKLIATCDFVASLSGRPIELKKGQEFKGSKVNAERLECLGFISEQAPVQRKRKDDE